MARPALPQHIKQWASKPPHPDFFLAHDYKYKPRQSETRWKRLALVMAGKYGLLVGEIAHVLNWPTHASVQRLERVVARLPRRARGIEVGGPPVARQFASARPL